MEFSITRCAHVCNEQLVSLELIKDDDSTARPSPSTWVEPE